MGIFPRNCCSNFVESWWYAPLLPNIYFIEKIILRSAPTNGADVETDYQRTQYIPDEGVVGKSATLREYDDQSSDEEEEIEKTSKQQSSK